MSNQAWVVWIDANGQQQVRSITTLTGASTIITELESNSNAVAKSIAEGVLTVPALVPTAAPYLSVRQVAYLTFTDGAGSDATIAVPAPHASIFGPDGDTINPATIAALIAACNGNLLSGAGRPVVGFVSGVLRPGPANN